MNFTTVDLKSDATSAQIEAFHRTIKEIVTDRSDALWKNYSQLSETYQTYDAFHCLFNSDDLVGFAAVQSHFFPEDLVRILSRSYIHPKYRGANTFPPTGRDAYLTDHILPLQVAWAQENGKRAVFVSFGDPGKKTFIEKWLRHLRSLHPNQNWTLLPNLHQTCISGSDPSCWQLIALLPFENNYCFPQAAMSFDQWRVQFGSGSDQK